MCREKAAAVCNRHNIMKLPDVKIQRKSTTGKDLGISSVLVPFALTKNGAPVSDHKESGQVYQSTGLSGNKTRCEVPCVAEGGEQE